jgi:hypothetical protein
MTPSRNLKVSNLIALNGFGKVANVCTTEIKFRGVGHCGNSLEEAAGREFGKRERRFVEVERSQSESQ